MSLPGHDGSPPHSPGRVLMLSWEYPPVVEGGLARHVGKLSEQLVRDGIEVDVLARGVRERPSTAGRPAVEGRSGVRVQRVCEEPPPKDLDGFLAWVARMNRDMIAAGQELARGRSYDIVHGHDWLVADASVAVAERLDAPYVCTIHATEHGRHQGWVAEGPQARIHGIERCMAARADGVIVCSRYMRAHVSEVLDLDAARINIIPNGIDRGDLAVRGDLSAFRAGYAAPGQPLVLLAGRLVHEKGFQLALDALAEVVERLPEARFVIAGSGTHEQALKAQAARLGLDAHGSFLGWIGDETLHRLYSVAEICVVPSLYEPFGLVALEAMASGCACVVADTGGLRELVSGAESVGLRFNSGDAHHLAVRIERLLVNVGLRRRLAAQAQEHVLRFGWNEVSRRTREVYGGLAAPGRTLPPARVPLADARR